MRVQYPQHTALIELGSMLASADIFSSGMSGIWNYRNKQFTLLSSITIIVTWELNQVTVLATANRPSRRRVTSKQAMPLALCGVPPFCLNRPSLRKLSINCAIYTLIELFIMDFSY